MIKQVRVCSLALLVVIWAFSLADGAAIGCDHHANGIGKPEELRVKRQVEESSEDSDEDDEGADEDAQQYQFAAQQAQVSQENSDEDNYDGREDDDAVGDFFIRRRRDVEKPAITAAEVDKAKPSIVQEKPEAESQAALEVKPDVGANAEDIAEENDKQDASAVPGTPPRKSSVLVLIRDALKKVTGGLPTEQVANQALQYFQLFEHFIQQTIEEYIEDDKDEDDAGATTVVPPFEGEASTAPLDELDGTEGIKVPEQPAAEQQTEPHVMATVATKPQAETVADKPATIDAETKPELNVV